MVDQHLQNIRLSRSSSHAYSYMSLVHACSVLAVFTIHVTSLFYDCLMYITSSFEPHVSSSIIFF